MKSYYFPFDTFQFSSELTQIETLYTQQLQGVKSGSNVELKTQVS